MRKWTRILGAAVRMGLTWGIPAALVGFGIEFVHNVWPNPLGRMVDIWPAMAIPAFLGGFTFSMLLAIVARGRKLEELSLPVFAALGTLGGVLVALAPAMMIAFGLASLHGTATVWDVTGPLVVPLALFGGGSAAGSLVLARRAERLELEAGSQTEMKPASDDVPRVQHGR